MQKLKTKLQYKHLYNILAIIAVAYSLIITKIPKYESIYNEEETNFICTLEEYKIDGNKLNLNLKCDEKLVGNYYIKTEEEKEYYENNLNIGSILKIKGNLTTPKETNKQTNKQHQKKTQYHIYLTTKNTYTTKKYITY